MIQDRFGVWEEAVEEPVEDTGGEEGVHVADGEAVGIINCQRGRFFLSFYSLYLEILFLREGKEGIRRLTDADRREKRWSFVYPFRRYC